MANNPAVRSVMTYVDFELDVDTSPDINDCMWIDMRTFTYGKLHFDMDEDCVRRLQDACAAFISNLEARRDHILSDDLPAN